MKKLKKSKFFLAVIIITTVVLAAVASFTAYRLYQLRQRPVAPNVPQGNVYAFSCEEYEMLIDTDGTVRIGNVSGKSQPSQEIEIIVGGQTLGSFTIPALDPQTNAEIGGINLPAGDFNWNIDGDILCSGNQSGTLHESQDCNPLSVKLASAQTIPTQNPSPTPTTPIPNPTSTLVPTNSPKNPTNTPTPTSTQNQVSANITPTSISRQSTQVTNLPDTGSTSITLIIIFSSLASIVAAALFLADNTPHG
jgi:hypothetical protein